MAASKIQPVPRSIPISVTQSTSNVWGSVAPNVNEVNVFDIPSGPVFLQPTHELPFRPNWRSVGTEDAPKLFEICTSLPSSKKRKTVDNHEVGVAARSAINAYNNPSTKSTLVQDRLGAYVDLYRLQLASSESWSAFALQVHGRSTLSEHLEIFPHPAAPLLCEMRDLGVPVQCFGPEWSAERLAECLHRGSHKSASEYAEFVREEMADFCDMNYWVVLPYEDVQHLPWLRLSPLGVVPQRER